MSDMVYHRCAVVGCNTSSRDPNVVRHYFPMDKKTRDVWIQRCGNQKLAQLPVDQLRRQHVICGKHFEEHCRPSTTNKRLVAGSVPTLNLPALVGEPAISESSSMYVHRPDQSNTTSSPQVFRPPPSKSVCANAGVNHQFSVKRLPDAARSAETLTSDYHQFSANELQQQQFYPLQQQQNVRPRPNSTFGFNPNEFPVIEQYVGEPSIPELSIRRIYMPGQSNRLSPEVFRPPLSQSVLNQFSVKRLPDNLLGAGVSTSDHQQQQKFYQFHQQQQQQQQQQQKQQIQPNRYANEISTFVVPEPSIDVHMPNRVNLMSPEAFTLPLNESAANGVNQFSVKRLPEINASTSGYQHMQRVLESGQQNQLSESQLRYGQPQPHRYSVYSNEVPTLEPFVAEPSVPESSIRRVHMPNRINVIGTEKFRQTPNESAAFGDGQFPVKRIPADTRPNAVTSASIYRQVQQTTADGQQHQIFDRYQPEYGQPQSHRYSVNSNEISTFREPTVSRSPSIHVHNMPADKINIKTSSGKAFQPHSHESTVNASLISSPNITPDAETFTRDLKMLRNLLDIKEQQQKLDENQNPPFHLQKQLHQQPYSQHQPQPHEELQPHRFNIGSNKSWSPQPFVREAVDPLPRSHISQLEGMVNSGACGPPATNESAEAVYGINQFPDQLKQQKEEMQPHRFAADLNTTSTAHQLPGHLRGLHVRKTAELVNASGRQTPAISKSALAVKGINLIPEQQLGQDRLQSPHGCHTPLTTSQPRTPQAVHLPHNPVPIAEQYYMGAKIMKQPPTYEEAIKQLAALRKRNAGQQRGEPSDKRFKK